MPDRRKHRGAHPEDALAFAAGRLATLQDATADLCWLLSRGYAPDSSLKLVGDRYALTARQRTAIARCACSDTQRASRHERRLDPAQVRGWPLWIDGYNVLTTIESALGGGVILAARDGTFRDMASMHSSFRKVEETIPAIALLGHFLAALGPVECAWLFDRPVSNSGRLRTVMEEMAAAEGWPWRVELVANPDRLLIRHPAKPDHETEPQIALPANAIVASADSAILDACGPWLNLAREAIVRQIPAAWIVNP